HTDPLNMTHYCIRKHHFSMYKLTLHTCQPRYLGPAIVITVTRTGVLIDDQPQWIHASSLKHYPTGEQASSNSK
uniref:Uncharacterized protein n=1 Tax=Cyprinus carpio TaxID=7962 RepID=A0A8C2FZ19_CYPCA